jgi:hypothetical protein
MISKQKNFDSLKGQLSYDRFNDSPILDEHKINEVMLKLRKRGKIIYVTYDTYRSLETVGNRYISRKFLDGRRISYNKSIKFLLNLLNVAEKIELTPRLNEDENEDV